MNLRNDFNNDLETTVFPIRKVAPRRSTLDLLKSILETDDYENCCVSSTDRGTMKPLRALNGDLDGNIYPSTKTMISTKTTSEGEKTTRIAKRRSTLDLLESMFDNGDCTTQEVPDSIYNPSPISSPTTVPFTNAGYMASTTPFDVVSSSIEPLDYRPMHDPFPEKGTSKISQQEKVQIQLQQQAKAQFINLLEPQTKTDKEIIQVNTTQLEVFMEKSTKSQQNLHDWDKFQMGLKKSHSKTMRLSRKSRKKLLTMLKKERTLKKKLIKKQAKTPTIPLLPLVPKASQSALISPLPTASKSLKSSMTSSSSGTVPIFPKPFHEIPMAA